MCEFAEAAGMEYKVTHDIGAPIRNQKDGPRQCECHQYLMISTIYIYMLIWVKIDWLYIHEFCAWMRHNSHHYLLMPHNILRVLKDQKDQILHTSSMNLMLFDLLVEIGNIY
jgi:hypothetical protein